MSGALHDETNYGKPRQSNGKTIVHIRKPIGCLSARDIENIVDDKVRDAVRAKAAELGGDLTKCESANDWPALLSKNGSPIPVKRVRIQKVLDVTPIASGERQRFVAVANNHHTAIFALVENDREVRWDGLPVSLYEAMERKQCRPSISGIRRKTNSRSPAMPPTMWSLINVNSFPAPTGSGEL